MTLDHPKRIGAYHVLQLVGEGGMGVIYEAEQREPVRRRVAVKMIKAGIDTRDVVGRFETERQALAVMDHPGIARVLDGGVHDDGKPYFAMEFVAGIPADEYCELHRLTIRERLELMIDICEAVQHAHQKGVIHRDLKPGNILVKEEAGRPLPKIIDFGIAKAIGQRMNEHTVATGLGQTLGTLAYMSPEQAEMTGIDVDTRTDVYSLGVILFELLVGRVPLDPADSGPQLFLLRLIQRDDPLPTMSRRLVGQDAARLKALAAARRLDGARLQRALSGDLQWIVAKAVEKDRSLRYDSAGSMATDLRRYLAKEPVSARAPSAGYRLRKFASRNRGVVVAAVLLVASLVTGTIGTTIGLLRARAAESSAAREAESSRRVAEFLAGLFALSDPAQARGRSMSARELLDTGAVRIRSLDAQPEIRARLGRTIGEVYTALGEYEAAAPLLTDALNSHRHLLGPNDPQTLMAAFSLADLYYYRGDYPRAESLFVDVAARRLATLGPQDSLTIAAQAAVGVSYVMAGRLKDAETALKTTLSDAQRFLGPNHSQTLSLLNSLQAMYYRQQRYADAESAALRVLDGRTRVLGPDHPMTATAVHNLGTIYSRQARFAEAERMLAQALATRRRVEGEHHPRVLGTLRAMADMYIAQQQDARAEPVLLEAIDGYARTIGLHGPEAQAMIKRLVDLYTRSGEREKQMKWRTTLTASR